MLILQHSVEVLFSLARSGAECEPRAGPAMPLCFIAGPGMATLIPHPQHRRDRLSQKASLMTPGRLAGVVHPRWIRRELNRKCGPYLYSQEGDS